MKTALLKKGIIYSAATGVALMAAAPAFAQTQDIDIQPGIFNVSVSANQIVRFTINTLIILGVLISLFFLLWGGIRWILSGGDKGKVDAARSTIVAAIVGLIIVILAYVIINTVLTILTGNGVGGFTLPTLTDPEGAVKGQNPQTP